MYASGQGVPSEVRAFTGRPGRVRAPAAAGCAQLTGGGAGAVQDGQAQQVGQRGAGRGQGVLGEQYGLDVVAARGAQGLGQVAGGFLRRGSPGGGFAQRRGDAGRAAGPQPGGQIVELGEGGRYRRSRGGRDGQAVIGPGESGVEHRLVRLQDGDLPQRAGGVDDFAVRRAGQQDALRSALDGVADQTQHAAAQCGVESAGGAGVVQEPVVEQVPQPGLGKLPGEAVLRDPRGGGNGVDHGDQRWAVVHRVSPLPVGSTAWFGAAAPL